MPPHQSAAHFLQFAIRLYSRPGAKDLLLTLQKDHKLNVNCLLLAAWAARLGHAIDAAAWQDLQKHTRHLHDEAVAPIRAVRLQISKNDRLPDALRAPIKRLLLYAELRAEQAEERALHDRMRIIAPQAMPGPALLRQNLATYASLIPELDQFATLVLESQLLE